jgi:OOP family OmpA-OmpF porin
MLLGTSMLAVSSAGLTQDAGFYVGGSIGQSKMEGGPCKPTLASGFFTSCDSTSTAWKALAGYQINRNFAVEAGYGEIGRLSTSGPFGSVDIKITAWEAVGIGAIPLANAFSVYGKLGVFSGNAKASSSGGIIVSDSSETETDLTWGFGARYDFTKQFAVRAEYQRYEFFDVTVIGIGVIFKF